MTEPVNTLTELISAYAAAESGRARGGIVALTGFEYQVWSYLADYAVALASNDLAAGGQQFANAFETLSDYTRATKGGTVCVQVKHHLDRRGMALAAVEFAAIERFLKSHHTAGFSDACTYEVVARSGSGALDWASIQLPFEIREREPDLTGHFERLRDEGRLLPPRFETDPHWKLIAAVYQALSDPFGFAWRSFALCMRRTREPASAASVRAAIAEDYTANLRGRPQSSRPLSPSDFRLIPDARGISLARTPTLLDFRSGCFMERPKRVDDAIAALDDMLTHERGLNEAAVPVLWIDGQSGSGKSVLLLQIMKHLVVERQASVVWSANGSEEIGGIVEQIANAPEHLRPDFIFVDDIYDPQSRDSLDVPRLTRLIVHSGVTTWPIVITCGPTEFRQDFERDCRAEGFRVMPWHLSTLDVSETSAVRAWFEARTGRLPEPGAASNEQRALMISVMFELAHGDLRPFAARFRSRLIEEKLDAALSVPLALNRLYIWTPRDWLSPADEERLERLNQDGDFSVLFVEGMGKGLFKLTHPHLSDAIYRALHPGAVPATFARHLIAAFERALSSHIETAARLLRAVASHPPRLDIADEAQLAMGMTSAWNTLDKAGLRRNVAAEMWVDWARFASRQPNVATLLATSPLETALGALDSDHPRWPSLWSRLWSCAPGETSLTQRALEWLPSHFGVDGWTFVWRRVAEQSVQHTRAMRTPNDTLNVLCESGLQWLRVSSHVSGWSRVWEQLVDAADLVARPLLPEVIREGVAWVSEHKQSRDWNFVWEKLATMARAPGSALTRNEIYELGAEWLTKYAYHPGWPFVWEHFMELSPLPPMVTRPELLKMAVAWSAGRENDPGWVFIAAKLAATGDEEARSRGLEGLVASIEQNKESIYWPLIWSTLLAHHRDALTPEQRRRLLIAARGWLAADDEREHVLVVLTHIFYHLNTILGDTDDFWLLNTSCNVLSRTVDTDDRNWAPLWFAVVRHLTQSPDHTTEFQNTVETLGLRWLGQPAHLNHGTWSQVYRRVFKKIADSEGVYRRLAITGIVQDIISDSAAFAAWLYSRPGEAPPDEFLLWLEQWFSGPARESGGFSVWKRLDGATSYAFDHGGGSQWEKLRKLLDRYRPEQAVQWAVVVERYRLGQPIIGRIVNTVLQKKWGPRPKRLGYVVDIGTNAFLPLEEAAIARLSESARLQMVGKTLEFDIIRLDEQRLQVDVSRRTVLQRNFAALEIGSVVEGRVKSITDYGVFIDLGFCDALLHISEMSERSSHPSHVFKLGQQVVTKIAAIDLSRRRVSLTMK